MWLGPAALGVALRTEFGCASCVGARGLENQAATSRKAAAPTWKLIFKLLSLNIERAPLISAVEQGIGSA